MLAEAEENHLRELSKPSLYLIKHESEDQLIPSYQPLSINLMVLVLFESILLYIMRRHIYIFVYLYFQIFNLKVVSTADTSFEGRILKT